MTDGLAVLPVRGIGDVTAGDDLAELIGNAAPWLRDGDILVVTSKIVSRPRAGSSMSRPTVPSGRPRERTCWRRRRPAWWRGAVPPPSSRRTTAS